MMDEIVEESAVKRRRRPPAAATFGPHGSETELAWAAGFWDGEGSMGCYFTSSNYKGIVRCSVAQIHPEVLLRFRNAVGMGHLYESGPNYHSRPRKMYFWDLSRYRDVAEFCFLLSPRVGSVKRKQMLDALDLYAQARF